MHIDFYIALAGLLVGFTVGLTGMGGGALMTPILVLVFGVQPLAAVSSDLVAAFIMKPVGSAVHLRHGTVNKSLVKWLVIGSVPFAFAGVLILNSLGNGKVVQDRIKLALGLALLMACASIVFKGLMQLRQWGRERQIEQAGGTPPPPPPFRIRPVPTMVIGAVGGVVVGMTSVGSGSLIIVLLLLLYPSLRAGQLVGTDLVQAVPLVGAAAIGHLIFGDFQFGLTTSLLVGSIPGVYLGARVSSRAPGGLVRRALVIVLLASGLKLVNVDTVTLAWIVGAVVIVGPLLWMGARRASGLEARPPRTQPEVLERPVEESRVEVSR